MEGAATFTISSNLNASGLLEIGGLLSFNTAQNSTFSPNIRLDNSNNKFSDRINIANAQDIYITAIGNVSLGSPDTPLMVRGQLEVMTIEDVIANLDGDITLQTNDIAISGNINANNGTAAITFNGDNNANTFTFNSGANLQGSSININGGEGNDIFHINATTQNGTTLSLNGGEGNDRFNIENSSLIAVVDGGTNDSDNDILNIGFTSSDLIEWTINDESNPERNRVEDTTFSNIEQADGSNSQDRFDINGNSVTTIDGRDGNDIFN